MTLDTTVGAGLHRHGPPQVSVADRAAAAAAELLYELETHHDDPEPPQDLEHAVRVLALVAEGAGRFRDVARFYAESQWTAGEGDFEPAWFFTGCTVCGGDLVVVGCHDSAPETCAACPDPDPMGGYRTLDGGPA